MVKTFIVTLCATVLICSKIAAAQNVTAVSSVIKKNTTVTVNAATTTRRPLLQGIRLPCSCLAGQCGCCTGYILDRLNQKACANLTYDPDDFAITAVMSMNDKVFYKNTFSGKNPPPICMRVPRLRFIEFCMEFSNIYFADRNVHLCMDAEANWEDVTLVEWSFDCVRMGVSGVAVVAPEDGGGVSLNPFDSEDQTDEDYDDSARNVPLKSTNNHAKTNRDFKIIFDQNLKSATSKVPDKKLISVRKLKSNDYLISFKK